jgi:hypothetical protein
MLAITHFIEIDLPPKLAQEANTPAKIISFGELPVGWHYGEGTPAAPSAIDLAQDIYWILLSLGYKQTDAFPGIKGEVMITGYAGPRYVELIAETDSTISIELEFSGKEIYSEERRSLEEAVATLEQFSQEPEPAEGQWSTSDSYIQSTSTLIPIRTASKAWLSEIPMEAAFQWSGANVSTTGAGQYVPMGDIFIPKMSQGIRQYSGNLMNLYYQREAS